MPGLASTCPRLQLSIDSRRVDHPPLIIKFLEKLFNPPKQQRQRWDYHAFLYAIKASQTTASFIAEVEASAEDNAQVWLQHEGNNIVDLSFEMMNTGLIGIAKQHLSFNKKGFEIKR